MMNVSEALRARHSCRAFSPDPVETHTLLSVLNDALYSPSWANSQPWEIFIACGDVLKKINQYYEENTKNHIPTSLDISRPLIWPESAKKHIKELMAGVSLVTNDAMKVFSELNQNFFYAPTVIYLCMDKSLTSWSMFDMGAISQSIMLAATEHGLSTMPSVELVHYPEVLRSQLDIPDNLSIVFGIAIGYKDRQHPINKFRSTRKPIASTVTIKGV